MIELITPINGRCEIEETAVEQRRAQIGVVTSTAAADDPSELEDGGSIDHGDGPPRPPQRPTRLKEGGSRSVKWKYLITYMLLFVILFAVNFLAFSGHAEMAKRRGWL